MELSDKDGNITEYGVARMLANPFYCIDIHPTMCMPHDKWISEEDFIQAGIKSIEEIGAEAYLKHLLENLKWNFI